MKTELDKFKLLLEQYNHICLIQNMNANSLANLKPGWEKRCSHERKKAFDELMNHFKKQMQPQQKREE